MPMNDVAAAVIYAEPGAHKHKTSKATPSATVTATATPTASMTNSSKADVMHHSSSGGGGGSGILLAPSSSLLLRDMHGQKWQSIFDMDKVIKQLRSAEKTYLRGGKGNNSSSDGQGKHQGAVLQVQRLNAQDMAYYDIAPKMAPRDIVICNACSGSYTKAGFNNHISLQHPAIWEATSNKVNLEAHRLAMSGAEQRALAATETSQDGGRETAATGEDNLSGAMSTCSNGSSSSASHSPYVAPVAVAASSSSSSSSRHKSSSKSSSSSSSATSKAGTSRSRSKSSKNRHHSTPSSAPEPTLHHKGANSKKSNNSALSSAIGAAPAKAIAAPAIVIATPPAVAVKEEAPITLYSSSSNSSCSLPPTPKMELLAGTGNAEHGSAYSPAEVKTETVKQETQPKKKLKGSLADDYHRSKHSKEKQIPPQYEQTLSELDQAVCSITGGDVANNDVAASSNYAQVDLSAVTEEPMPMHNTSDDNSISLTLDDMLDSKFINEILNTAESDIPFDESALDTSQQQQLQQQQNAAGYQQQTASKRLRYDDGTIHADASEYATAAAIYQQQQQYEEDISSQAATDVEAQEQTQQLTAIDAMQLQQLIYQQQQMLEQKPAQQQHLDMSMTDYQVDAAAALAQFSVYNVPSLTDDAAGAATTTAAATAEQHMILPGIIYEITDNNQVSELDQQSQQQVIAEFLTQAGYNNVNVDVNVLQAPTTAAATATADGNVSAMGVANQQNFADELGDFDFTKLETVSAEAATHTKTVKLEASQPQQQQPPPPTYSSYPADFNRLQPHRQLVNAKYQNQEDTYFNVLLYAGAPRPLAMNSFGLVKLPGGAATTLHKSLLTTRKANNNLLSLNGNNGGIVGNLKKPLSHTAANEFSIGSVTITSNGNAATPTPPPAPSLQNGKTIYAQRSSVIMQERVKCNKRALVSKMEKLEKLSSGSGQLMTAKRLSDLLSGKAKPDREEASEEQQQLEDIRTHSFYEKRRKLLANRQKQQQPHGLVRRHQQLMRQQSLHVPLPLLQSHQSNGSNASSNVLISANPNPLQRQEQLLKKQLLRTLSDCGSSSNIIAGNGGGSNNNNNPWKSNNSTPGSNSAGSDLMRVFV